MFDESPSIINVPLGDLPRERSESRVLKGVHQISDDESNSAERKKKKPSKLVSLTCRTCQVDVAGLGEEWGKGHPS